MLRASSRWVPSAERGTALFAPVEGPLLLPLALAAGVLAGALWAAIVAALRTLCHANEILSSLMLVYVAELLLLWLVQGPWRDPDGFNFPETALLPEAALLPVLAPGTRLHWGVLFALPVVAGLYVVLARTSFGFGLQVSGDGERAARFAGFRRGRIIWAVLLLSGGLAGLAGAAEVSGVVGQLVPVISPGYGFTAIIVAFLARLRPLGALAASLLVALTYLGGETAQISLALPHAAAGVFQGLLLFTVLGSGFVLRCRLRLVFPAKTEPGPPAAGGTGDMGGATAAGACGRGERRERIREPRCTRQRRQCGRLGPMWEISLIALSATIIAASLPLLLAALGELAAERAGVLNLGLEGMMLTGAVLAFIFRVETGSPWAGGSGGGCGRSGAGRPLRPPRPRTAHEPGGDGLGAHHLRNRALGPARCRLCRPRH